MQELFRRDSSWQLKLWLRVFLIAIILYLIGLAILYLTENPILFPAVALLGSFAVPITFVAFFYENRQLSRLKFSTVVFGFIYGGALGVFAASFLETIFLTGLSIFTLFGVGLIEELAKILPIFIITKGDEHNSQLDGIIVGVSIGMGFAALESLGYSFAALLLSGGSLSLSVGITLLRAFLAPFGHGVWTGILGGVLFRESLPYHFRINWVVFLAYLGVSALHGFWDVLPAVMEAVFGTGLAIFLGEALVALTGILILYRLWQDGKRRQIELLKEG